MPASASPVALLLCVEGPDGWESQEQVAECGQIGHSWSHRDVAEKERCSAGDGSALDWRDDGYWAEGCHREAMELL